MIADIVAVGTDLLVPPVLAPVGTSKSGGLFLLRDHRVSGATPEHPAPAPELDEDELVVGTWLLFSVLPMVAWLGRAQATTSLPSAREDVLRPKLLSWDPDILDLVGCKVTA